MTTARTIVELLLEDEEDFDSDWKDVVLFQTHDEVDQWLKINLPKIGFTYRDMGVRGWEKVVGNRMLSIGSSTVPGQALMVLYRRTATGRWQQEEIQSVDCGIPILTRLLDWRIVR